MKFRHSLASILLASSLLISFTLLTAQARAAAVLSSDAVFVEDTTMQRGPPPGLPPTPKGGRGGRGGGGGGGRVPGAPEPGFYALLAASGALLGLLYLSSRRQVARVPTTA